MRSSLLCCLRKVAVSFNAWAVPPPSNLLESCSVAVGEIAARKQTRNLYQVPRRSAGRS